MYGGRRWLVALAGTALQLCIGTVYAWSFFQKPLCAVYGRSAAEIVWAFSLAIFCLGLTAAWGGTQLRRFGPRPLAIGGAVLFGCGYLLAGWAVQRHSLGLLYLGYGVVGGIGLGLTYVTPVATVARWFPDKKGLVTGMVIMGFGLGALLMSKLLAPQLLAAAGGNLAQVFSWLGIGLGGAAALVSLGLSNPPADFSVPGIYNADSATGAAPLGPSGETTLLALCSPQFALMWGVFFCNIVAGISLIGFQSPLFQDRLHAAYPAWSADALAGCGATLIAVSSLFNGVGRMLWGGISDRLGRAATFRWMLASQIAVLGLLLVSPQPMLFAAAVCYVLLCYGGGFGTMPSFVLDAFGSRRMPVVYGAILTAWSVAGVVGPQLVAFLQDHYPARAASLALALTAGFLAVGLALGLGLGEEGIRD